MDSLWAHYLIGLPKKSALGQWCFWAPKHHCNHALTGDNPQPKVLFLIISTLFTFFPQWMIANGRYITYIGHETKCCVKSMDVPPKSRFLMYCTLWNNWVEFVHSKTFALTASAETLPLMGTKAYDGFSSMSQVGGPNDMSTHCQLSWPNQIPDPTNP